MSASGSAPQRRRAFIERIERLEEERKSIADDIADVYKELTADGHEKEAVKIIIKIRRKDDGLSKWVGHSGTVDEYLSDLGMLPKFEEARAGARARENIEQFPPHNPETGELTDTQEQPETATQSETSKEVRSEARDPSEPGTLDRVDNEYAGTSSDENPAPISPSVAPPADTVAEPQAPQAATVSHSHSSDALLPVETDRAEAGEEPASAVLSDAEIPAFLKSEQRKSIADYRPHCLNPDACGATGLTHCYSCRKAMEAASETEAAA